MSIKYATLLMTKFEKIVQVQFQSKYLYGLLQIILAAVPLAFRGTVFKGERTGQENKIEPFPG